MKSYEFRRLSLETNELETIARLFQRIWPGSSHLTINYLDWLYRKNPDGQALGFNAWEDDKMAGHYAVIPFFARFAGQRVKSALSLNTAVGEEHRGQGLFKKLAELTYEYCSTQGIHHVVGIANANSTPGFVKSLGFQWVTSLEARVLCGRPRFESDYAFEWRRQWEGANLKWRLSCPDANYWYESGAHEFSVLGKTKYRGVNAILKTENSHELEKLIADNLVPRKTFRPVLWFGTRAGMRIPKSFAVPQRLRPSPFNLIFRGLKDSRHVLNSKLTHFEAADFDVM